jgi:hypothetical protein
MRTWRSGQVEGKEVKKKCSEDKRYRGRKGHSGKGNWRRELEDEELREGRERTFEKFLGGCPRFYLR